MSLTPSQRRIAARAAELLQQGSCIGVFARDANGNATHEHSPDAASFCLVGALRRARLEEHRRLRASVGFIPIDAIARGLNNKRIKSWMDAMEWWDTLPASGQLLAIAKLAELGSEQTLPPPASPD